MDKIKVLVIDDSAVARQAIAKILATDSDIDVVGTAVNAALAFKKIKVLKPDVLTLDIELPDMDGLAFLENIMQSSPLPVVMVSALTGKNTPAAFKALELGAIDIIEKPNVGVREHLHEISIQIVDAVKAAAQALLKKRSSSIPPVQKKFTADAILPQTSLSKRLSSAETIIAIGASTGGTDALTDVLKGLPANSPGVVVVQHMPALFTRSFAERLNQVCSMRVKEATHGDLLQAGTVFISPGDQHMIVTRSRPHEHRIELQSGPLVNRHRPSVDVLFRSVAQSTPANAIGVILTGMGDDGARGLLEMKQGGAQTIAQDEASCVVFGMPKVAIKLGGVDHILPLADITEYLVRLLKLNHKD